MTDTCPFDLRYSIRRVSYSADTCSLMIRPGGSHMMPPVPLLLVHIITYKMTRTILLTYISQAYWVAEAPDLTSCI